MLSSYDGVTTEVDSIFKSHNLRFTGSDKASAISSGVATMFVINFRLKDLGSGYISDSSFLYLKN